MKILHLTNTVSEGGVETFLLQLLPAMKENNQCTLFVLNRHKVELQSQFEESGISLVINSKNSIYNPFVLFDLLQIAREYDIIHSHLFPTQYYVAFLKFLFFFTRSKAKFVTTEHCTTNKRRKKNFRLLEKVIYRAYDKIVCVSDASAENLKKWVGNKRDAIETIHNGINFQHVINASPYTKKDLDLPDESVALCMTARFFDQKDHKTLIRAMSYLSDIYYLVLIGSGEAQKECAELCENLGLDSRVRFLGRRRDVPSILKAVDLCVLSTHYEGMPVSILEYFAAAKPVIATNVGGVRELLIDDSLLSKPEDPKDLAEKILSLASSHEKMIQESNNNLKKIEKYTLSRMTSEYLNTYKALTSAEKR